MTFPVADSPIYVANPTTYVEPLNNESKPNPDCFFCGLKVQFKKINGDRSLLRLALLGLGVGGACVAYSGASPEDRNKVIFRTLVAGAMTAVFDANSDKIVKVATETVNFFRGR